MKSKRLLTALIAAALCAAAVVQAAGPVYWDYPEYVPFEEMDGDGIALDEFGRLIPGLAVEELLASGPEVVWTLATAADGTIWAGCGHDGQVWRVEDGEATLHCSLPEPEIFGLAVDGGTTWAAGGPDGLLYRIEADGEFEVWADLPEGYIWQLLAGTDGEVYAAVGSPAAVYRIRGRHEVERLAVLPATNALDLVWQADGSLLVATQGPGLLYRLDPERPLNPRLLAEIDQEEVRHLRPGPRGEWHALAITESDNNGANGNGNGNGMPSGNGNGAVHDGQRQSALYRIDERGLVTPVWHGEAQLLAVVWDEDLGWLAAGRSRPEEMQPRLLALGAPGQTRTIATWEGGDVLDMVLGEGDDRRVHVAMAYPGRVLSFSRRPAEKAEIVGDPIDAGRPIHWGRLCWTGEADGGATVEWSVRGGARAQPDESWSDWLADWDERDHAIELEACRYLQWRVRFGGEASSAFVEGLTISGREENVAPTITSFVMQRGGLLGEGAMHGHDENITESFPSGLRAEYNLASKRSREVPLERAEPLMPLRSFLWTAEDLNGDRLEFQLEYRRVADESWRPIGEPTPEIIGSWDTSTVPDGRYVVRVTATDTPSNPRGEALRSSRRCAPLTIDNTEPAIDDFKLRRTDAGFRVALEGRDETSPLAEAWLELPDGRRERLDPVDRICDSRREIFDLALPWPPADGKATAEPWRVKVLLADRAGNLAVAEGEVR